MTTDQSIVYCEWVSTLALIIVLYLWIGYSPYRKQIKRSVYQKELDRYFRIMKWYGFTDEEAAEELFKIKSFRELRAHNKRADKERAGKI